MTIEAALAKFKPLVPEGYDVRDYLNLINTQLMGVDKAGHPRSAMDLTYFLSVAKQVQLSPLARQIYPVFRWNGKQGREVMTIQTSIDGFRLIAQRSGKYAGQDDAVFEEEGQEGEMKFPVKATVTVYLFSNGQRVPVTASARYNEYVQKDNDGRVMGLWVKMPYTMLAKCAESLALRKAFPAELSGLYTSEEMSQSRDYDDEPKWNEEAARVVTEVVNEPVRGNPETEEAIEKGVKEAVKSMTPDKKPKDMQETEVHETVEPLATAGQVRMIYGVAKTKGIKSEDIHDSIIEKYGLDSFTKLTKPQASEVLDELLKMKSPAPEEPEEGEEDPGIPEVDNATTFDKVKK